MKKACLSFLLLLIWGYTHAQIAEWIIPPVYDNVNLADGSNLIAVDSAKTKIFFNQNGQRLFSTTETLHAFSDGCAVLTDESNSVLGIYDYRGKLLTSFNNRKVKVANDYPFYSDGYLILKKNRYYFVDKQGVVDKTQHLRVYPFHNGYAVCRDYRDPQKKLGAVNYLVDNYKREVTLTYKGKAFDASDVSFISSVNDEKIAFVVIKKAIYVYNANTRLLTPLYFQNSSSNKQAKLKDELPTSFDEATNVIYAQCGKDEQITICFDNHLVPTDISYNDEKYHYAVNPAEPVKPKTSLQVVEENNLFGLAINGKTVIPAQFEAINCCLGDQALVKTSGKQGMLKVIENVRINLTINENKDVAFRHKTFETSIRADMTTNVNPSKIDISANPEAGYTIDKLSKRTNVTDYGNRAEYTCELNIPAAVTENTAEFNYPIQMSYDNIAIMPFTTKVKAWRDNFYEIEVNDKEKAFDKKTGLLSFPYSVTMERLSIDMPAQFELEASPDEMEAELQQTSATQGVCVIPVANLEEGENYLFIELTEEGCPPLSFPFTITYTKAKGQKQPTKTSFKISKTIDDEY